MCSFPEQYPCIVLSAMGKVRVLCTGLRSVTTASPDASCQPCMMEAVVQAQSLSHLCCCLQTTNLLLEAGEQALVTPPGEIAHLESLKCVPGHKDRLWLLLAELHAEACLAQQCATAWYSFFVLPCIAHPRS